MVMVKKQNKKLKVKGKATPAHPKAKSNPKRICLLNPVRLLRASVQFTQLRSEMAVQDGIDMVVGF